VENGFSDKQERHLKALAEKLKTKTQPFAEPIKKPKAQWLKPKLRGDVEYHRQTTGGLSRHPSYKGLRED
jgi:bifunctional non-homologous end joining protein LigD